jgi:DNA-binding transcriptional MerR regulator
LRKATEAFRNISEVSEELGVKKHVLRFWETRFPQLKPMKRGGGRRYYRPADLELLRGIRRLLQSEGYSVRGVQKILREGGLEEVKRMGRDQPATRRASGRTRIAPPPQLPAPPTPAPTSRLNQTQVGMLRDVVAELAALQAMLRDVEQGPRADAASKRATARR